MSTTTPRLPGDLTWLIILLFSILWLPFLHSRAFSTNDASRMAAIESLVHRQTWAINESPFAHTVDKIQVGEQFFSSKPPTLAFLGAGVYSVLHHGFGLTLRWDECVPQREDERCRALFEPQKADWAYVILVFLLVSTPVTLILTLTYRLARRRGMTNPASLLFVLALGLGTALWPYSTIFVNHPLAAAGIVGAVFIFLYFPQPTAVQLAIAGFVITLSATIDLSAAIFLVGVSVFVLLTHRRRLHYFILGGLLPGLLAIVLNLQITGSPLPPQLYTPGYEFQGSAFRLAEPVRLLFAGPEETGDPAAATTAAAYTAQDGTESDSFMRRVAGHIFQMSVGEYGLFAFYPLVLWYLYALGRSMRGENLNERGLAIVLAVTAGLYFLYFGLRPHTFGGFVFGPRWLLNPVPVFALFATDPALYKPRRLWRVALLGGLGLISVTTAYTGTVNPWAPSYPLLRLTGQPPALPQPVAAAISGYGRSADAEPDISDTFGLDTVNWRWFDARSGFVVPPKPTWWFIHESTPPGTLFADQLVWRTPKTVGLYADLSSPAQTWLDGFETGVFTSSQLFPQDGETTENTAPINLKLVDDSVYFAGYELLQTESHLQLVTAWEIADRHYPTGERRIFLHLLAQDGTIAAQQDIFSFRYDSLFPGDLFFQQHELSLAEVEDGRYWLQIGMYDPHTGNRLQTAAGEDRLLLSQVIIEE